MIVINCNNCGTRYEFKDSKLNYTCLESNERQMGTEKMYSGTIEFSCNKCQNNIIVEFSFWEYPVQALNYSEYNEEGCIVTEEPNYQSYLINPANENDEE